ncbi:M20/M25/M40 family metallo-hydrolase [Peptoniphilus duerdenii]|uniref:M20/M25/M40 family metallo-hydrolase n=1 Tax=Peptoniphilus duerdenii TaxID=507750 RepID=UPI00288AC7B2|nr:M20/M25/M40 family metallo-hydrolase [Peptoniphilus duerdenii]
MANKIIKSGTVHDCMILSDLCKVGMIFVPSKDGISHNPNEDTDFADIEKGANVLLATLIALAN